MRQRPARAGLRARLGRRAAPRPQRSASLPAVRVVTDSTACLPAAAASAGSGRTSESAARQPLVVPLVVTARQPLVVPSVVAAPDGGLREGVDLGPKQIAGWLAAGEEFTTSQPPPAAFAAAFNYLAGSGAREVVAIHLSGELSGTCAAAFRAAQRAQIPVRVVDSRTTGMALGFAARAAARCAAAGGSAEQVTARARAVAASAGIWFAVDSLDALRQGGRISPGLAAIGAALGVRPILAIEQGRIVLSTRARGRSGARAKLIQVALAHAASLHRPVAAVHHVGVLDEARGLAAQLAPHLRAAPIITPTSAALAAHVGFGSLAIAVADLDLG